MSTNSKILIIEDEESLAKGLEYNLVDEGYEVDWAENGKEGLDMFNSTNYDIIILDIMLPFLDGFEVAKNMKQVDPQIPILILTARTSDRDKISGLEHGADDYMTKPFNLDELILRIRGMLKRKAWYQNVSKINPVYKFGQNTIYFEKLICVREEKEILLTQKEAMVIRYLIERKDKVVTREELLENVWHTNPEIETRTIDNFIVRLRKIIEDDPSNPVYIKSIRSAGYIFSHQ
jgi:DNA-binding response OmpR family regulator